MLLALSSFGFGALLHFMSSRLTAPVGRVQAAALALVCGTRPVAPAPAHRADGPPAARPAASAPTAGVPTAGAPAADAPTADAPAAGARPAAEPRRAVAERHIVVSLERRRLWLLGGRDTLLASPIAVGRGETFVYEGHRYRFATPRGHLKILSKTDDPLWVPPDWHYYEKAVAKGLQVVRLAPGDSVPLSDGTAIVVHGNDVGRVNLRGQFWSWTPGLEVALDGKIFIPPPHSPQRHVPDALGPYKLGLGGGVFIHGTNPYDSASIGQAVSHGCIRMPNALLHALYGQVDVGTPVDIH